MFYSLNDQRPPADHNPINAVKNIIGVKLVMRETYHYQPQYLRPYQVNSTTEAVNKISNVLAQKRMPSELTPSAFTGVAGSLMDISAAPESNHAVAVPNGWSERRISFLLHVVVEYVSGGVVHHHIQGYTDGVGVTRGTNYIDPNMVFFVNNIVTSKPTYHGSIGPNGEQINGQGAQAIDNYHVMSNTSASDAYYDPGLTAMLRPVDMISAMMMQDVMRGPDSIPKSIFDQRTVLGNQPKSSSRENSLPSNYTARIMSRYLAANELAELGQSDQQIYNNAAERLNEADPIENPFLAALSRSSSNISGLSTSRFRYRDLIALDPGVDQRRHMFFQDQVINIGPQGTNAAGWEGGTIHHRYAAFMAHAVPALMMDLMIGEVSFTSENMTTGRPVTYIVDGQGFSSMDMTRHWSAFITRFEDEVIRELSYNNQQSYSVVVHSNIYTETKLAITVEHLGTMEFVVPTFADGLFAPVVTRNASHLMDNASAFEAVMRASGDALGSAYTGAKYDPMLNTNTSSFI